MKINGIKLLCISIYLLMISCDNNLLNQGNQNDVDNKNNDSDNIHLLTGVISAQNYSSDSDNYWLTISNPNILKNESMVQIQFKSPGHEMYAVYTEWPIPPENFYTEIKTIYQSSMSISSDSKTQYKYIDIPQITQSIIDSGAVLVYYEIESGEWWGAPFTHSIDIDDNLMNIDYAMHYDYMFSLGTLYIHIDSSTEMDWYTTGSFRIKIVIIPPYYEDYWAYYAMYIDDGSIYMLDESNGHKIGWDYKLIVINP